jgi:hypothetical protein
MVPTPQRKAHVMSLTPEQLAKLPKYVRDHVALLEKNLASAYAKIQEGPEGANVWNNPYSDVYRKPVGKDVTLQFGSEDGNHFVVKYEGAKDRLDVIGYGDHSERLVIAPRGGNCLHIAMTPLEY